MTNLDDLYPIQSGQSAFNTFLKPQVSKLLTAVGMDVVYERGLGDLLFKTGASGEEEAILDLLGGFGASLMGHNHPELVARAISLLNSGRPFNVQASARSYAGSLAEKLAARLKQSTGHEYMATLANTGAEAIEAAIKHAEYEDVKRKEHILLKVQNKLRILQQDIREGRNDISKDLFEQAERIIGQGPVTNFQELDFGIAQFNSNALLQPGIFLALEGSFHGKTTGALQLTYNPEFRDPWRNLGISVKFLPFDDLEAAQDIIMYHRSFYIDIDLSQPGSIKLVRKTMTRIVACFIEPIQGEGGVREVDPDYFRQLRELANEYGFPLVIDEIQTMGRTGTFLATESIGVFGDYYTFSKALSGGLAKMSALLIRKERNIESFGYLHTSTFADDCFSSAIALGVMELLERDNDLLIKSCTQKGQYLIEKLIEIQREYPSVIGSIRGRGLMLGVEFLPQTNSTSPMIELLSSQHILGYVISGYLLNEMKIRVAPTISSQHVIRIEPSVYISYEQLDLCVEGFRRIAVILGRGDSFQLCAYLAGRQAGLTHSIEATGVKNKKKLKPQNNVANAMDRRVAFIGHFLEPHNLTHWDKNLTSLTPNECQKILERTQGVLDPFIVSEATLHSEMGITIGVTVIGIPLSSEQFAQAMHKGETDEILNAISKAINLAKNRGVGVIGFGGYTSIITNNCTEIIENSVGLTSGNTLTSAAAIEAIKQTAAKHNIDLHQAKLGVVGAAGNIGKMLAEVMADEVGSITLITRNRAQRRLTKLLEDIYENKLQQDLSKSKSGIDKVLIKTKAYKQYQQSPSTPKEFRLELEAELGENTPIKIIDDIHALRDCDLIVSATNSPDPIIFPEHIGNQPVVICDVATPRDISEAVVKEKKNAVVIKGGIVKLPGNQTLELGGLDMDPRNVYACMAETLILGMTGMHTHFSYGALMPARVRQIRGLAKIHGFSFDIQIAE